MNSRQPLVSVVISVYNEENFILKSLESIVSQTYKNVEIRIVDDNSTDNTYTKLLNFEKKHKNLFLYKNEKNIGLTKSLNFLISESKGDLIARQDSDDVSSPKRIEQQVLLMNNYNLDFCGTRSIHMQSKRIIPKYSYYIPINILKHFKNPFIHGSLIFKKTALEEVGFYNENFYYAQDYKLIIDLLKKGLKCMVIKEPLYELNMSNNISSKFREEQQYYADCARKGILPKVLA